MSTLLWHVWVSRCLLFRLKQPFSQISVCLGKYTALQLPVGAAGERYNIPRDGNMNCFCLVIIFLVCLVRLETTAARRAARLPGTKVLGEGQRGSHGLPGGGGGVRPVPLPQPLDFSSLLEKQKATLGGGGGDHP